MVLFVIVAAVVAVGVTIGAVVVVVVGPCAAAAPALRSHPRSHVFSCIVRMPLASVLCVLFRSYVCLPACFVLFVADGPTSK